MCTVQVLLFADVTRRSDVSYHNTSNSSVPRGLCRRLFADDSPRQSSAALLKTLEADLERQVKEKWNFDFRTGVPLPGRYQWVAVRPGVATAERVPSTDSVVVSEVPKTDVVTDDRTEKRPGSKDKRPRQHSSRSPATQSKITDFLQQRKRHRTGLDSDLYSYSPKLKSRRLQLDSVTSESSVTSE